LLQPAFCVAIIGARSEGQERKADY